MLPSATGRLPISVLRIHVDLTLAPWRALVEDMRVVLRARPKLELWIVCPSAQKRRVRQLLGDAFSVEKVRIIGYAPQEGPIHNWACDDGKWFVAPPGLLVAAGRHGRHAHYPQEIRNTQIFLAKEVGVDLLGVDMAFDCGDIVAGERHVLVGEWTLARNQRAGASRRTVLGRFSELFGRPVLPIETPTVQGCKIHVDSEVCLLWDVRTRRETALVNDPRLTLALLSGLSASSMRSRRGFEDAVRTVFEDRLRSRASSIKGFRAFFAGANVEASWESALRAPRIARQLRRKGYPVEFVPSFIGRSTPVFPQAKKKTTLAILTYANAVVDQGAILLSHFGVPALDRYAAGVARRIHYRVVPMRSSMLSWRLLGGPHCLSNAMRSPGDEP